MGATGKLFCRGSGKASLLVLAVVFFSVSPGPPIEKAQAKQNGNKHGNKGKGHGGNHASFGQAMSKQKKSDWEGAIAAYNALIDDLWENHPNSILLPKSYVGRAYCAIQIGDLDLAYESWTDLWTTGAWANPNLPNSPEFEAYRLMAAEDYAGAIRSFVRLIGELPEGTKRRQEAQLSLAVCHILVGGNKHYKASRDLLEDVIEEAGDNRITAFAHWLNGLTLLGFFDALGAQASFDAALATDPNLDPSDAMLEMLDDQLSPSVNVASTLGQSGADLMQLAEDYANAWGLTMNARFLEAEGDIEGAQELYEQADALLGQDNVASQSFGNHLLQ